MSGLGKCEQTKHTEELYILQAMEMFGFVGCCFLGVFFWGGELVCLGFWGQAFLGSVSCLDLGFFLGRDVSLLS